jgi:ABC-type amino acid transport system permease subunit
VITYPAGTSIKTVTLSIKGDVLDEDDETFTVALSNPTGNATLGTPSSLTITIISRAMEPLTDLADRTMNLWILLFIALLAVIASMIIGVIFLVMRNGMPGPEAIIGIGAVAIALGVMVIICFVFIYVNGTLTNLLNGLGM